MTRFTAICSTKRRVQLVHRDTLDEVKALADNWLARCAAKGTDARALIEQTVDELELGVHYTYELGPTSPRCTGRDGHWTDFLPPEGEPDLHGDGLRQSITYTILRDAIVVFTEKRGPHTIVKRYNLKAGDQHTWVQAPAEGSLAQGDPDELARFYMSTSALWAWGTISKKNDKADLKSLKADDREACRRCGGAGIMLAFLHVDGGICFDCQGSGDEADTHRAKETA